VERCEASACQASFKAGVSDLDPPAAYPGLPAVLFRKKHERHPEGFRYFVLYRLSPFVYGFSLLKYSPEVPQYKIAACFVP
jgi:hypothetical protein